MFFVFSASGSNSVSEDADEDISPMHFISSTPSPLEMLLTRLLSLMGDHHFPTILTPLKSSDKMADSIIPQSRTTRYEMVGAFSRTLTSDEQIVLKEEIRQLAQSAIPVKANREVDVQDPYFPTSQSVTIPFSVAGEPLSSEELRTMLVPLKRLFNSDVNTENTRMKRDAFSLVVSEVRAK